MPDDHWRSADRTPSWSRDLAFREQDFHLLDVLATHSEREGAAIDSYQKLIEQSEDEGIRYLGQLILEDEERHHRMIDEMVNRVRSFVEELEIEPSTPELMGVLSNDLKLETKRLLKFEKNDLAELRQLRKDLKLTSAYPMLSLLVDLLVHDTRKHIKILEHILKNTKR